MAGGDLEFKSKKILEEGEIFDTPLSSFRALFFPADHLGKHFLPLKVHINGNRKVCPKPSEKAFTPQTCNAQIDGVTFIIGPFEFERIKESNGQIFTISSTMIQASVSGTESSIVMER